MLHRKVSFMYQNSILPGAYNFMNEIKFLADMLRKQLDIIIQRIDSAEKKLG